jgi:hypothetical protein
MGAQCGYECAWAHSVDMSAHDRTVWIRVRMAAQWLTQRGMGEDVPGTVQEIALAYMSLDRDRHVS